ncbi:MAG: addiction module protein [Bacteroidales bacterium]|nr:addiction module protein [Bacteroidales bacterium]
MKRIDDLKDLPLEEKIEVIQQLWEDVFDKQDRLQVPEAHKRILDNRLKQIENKEGTFKSWEEVISKYSKK